MGLTGLQNSNPLPLPQCITLETDLASITIELDEAYSDSDALRHFGKKKSFLKKIFSTDDPIHSLYIKEFEGNTPKYMNWMNNKLQEMKQIKEQIRNYDKKNPPDKQDREQSSQRAELVEKLLTLRKEVELNQRKITNLQSIIKETQLSDSKVFKKMTKVSQAIDVELKNHVKIKGWEGNVIYHAEKSLDKNLPKLHELEEVEQDLRGIIDKTKNIKDDPHATQILHDSMHLYEKAQKKFLVIAAHSSSSFRRKECRNKAIHMQSELNRLNFPALAEKLPSDRDITEALEYLDSNKNLFKKLTSWDFVTNQSIFARAEHKGTATAIDANKAFPTLSAGLVILPKSQTGLKFSIEMHRNGQTFLRYNPDFIKEGAAGRPSDLMDLSSGELVVKKKILTQEGEKLHVKISNNDKKYGQISSTEEVGREVSIMDRLMKIPQIIHAKIHAHYQKHIPGTVLKTDIDAGKAENLVGSKEAIYTDRKLTDLSHFNERMSPNEKVGILLDLANALKGCQNAHVVHLDLKPENIFISRKSGKLEAFLADFGEAKVSKKGRVSTPRGAMPGNAYYKPPECFDNNGRFGGATSLSEKLDNFAFGMMMYEILHNRKFSHEELQTKERGQLRDKLYAEGGPPQGSLDSIVYRLLAADPEDRLSFSAVCRELKSKMKVN